MHGSYLAEPLDVFLSYSRADTRAAERIGASLRERDLRVFLDREYLVPGDPWPERLEAFLATSGAVSVCLGPTGLGHWQKREVYVALDRQAAEAGFPVIPVLLPSAKDPPLGFLRLNTWVDLRQGLDDKAALDLLARAIRGQPPPSAGTPDPRATICPYRGLEAFREEDAPFFFGRERVTDRLVTKVGQSAFLGVVGASGCGKSSVVLAGLLPALRRSADGRVWEIGVMRPSANPLQQVAALFLPPEPGVDPYDRIATLKKRAKQLRSGQVTLADVVQHTLDKQRGTERLLLVVDQWEELYAPSLDPEERDTFLACLLAKDVGRLLSVVLTLRGDFYGRALTDRALADRLQDAVVNVGPMERNELERAIVAPAKQVGLRLEDGLVEHILNEVGKEPGNLPLLGHLLAELWTRRGHDGRLTFAAYSDTGGVKRAIAKRAETEFNKLTVKQQEAARRFLIRLVTPGEGCEDTRAQAEIPEENQAVLEVINRFSDARLVTTSHDDATNQDVVEVSHEALIREWGTLRKWVDTDREFLRTVERVKAAKRAWEEETEDKDSRLLPAGRPLAEACELLERKDAVIDDVRSFIQASLARERRREDEERRKEAAVRKRLLRWAIAASTLFIAAAAAAAVAIQRHHLADTRLEQVRTAESLRLAKEAEETVKAGEPDVGVAIALEALPTALDLLSDTKDSDLPVHIAADTGPAGRALAFALSRQKLLAFLNGHEDLVYSAAWSPDGTRVVTASEDGTARIWDATSGAELVRLGEHKEAVYTAAWSPDASRIVTASEDGTALLWDAVSGEVLVRFAAHQLPVYWAAFSPDGTRIATASLEDTARVWNTENGKELARLEGHEDTVNSAAWSPDGTQIVTASEDKTARVWDAASGAEVAPLKGHAVSVWSAAYSPDGTRVATASLDGTAGVWSATTHALIARLRGHGGKIRSAAWSPDGERLVTASDDGTARLWDADNGIELAKLEGHLGKVNWAAWSPDGTRIVTASDDGTARVWDVGGAVMLAHLKGHQKEVRSAAWSPDSERIVTASGDGTARIWEIASGTELARLERDEGVVMDAAWDPDGTRIVTVSGDGVLRIWDVASRTELEQLTRTGDSINSATWSPDGTRIVTASSEPRANLDVREGRRGIAQVWDVAAAKELVRLEGHEDLVNSAAWSPDGTRIVTASRDKTARIWHAESGAEFAVLVHEDSVNSAAWSPDGTRLVTASSDTTARVWDAARGAEVARLEGHDGIVMDAAWSPNGIRLVTASDDRTARVWNATSGAELARLEGHGDWVRSVAWSPDGTRIVTASSDGTARVWSPPRFNSFADLLKHAACLNLPPLSERKRRALHLVGPPAKASCPSRIDG